MAPTAPMNYLQCTGWFFKLFYRLGVSPNLSHSYLKNNSRQSIREAVLMVMQIIIVYYMAITVGVNMNSGNKIHLYSRPDIVFNYIFSICEMVRCSCVFMQCIFQKYALYDIVNTFRKIESFFVIHLRYRIVYVAFKKQFLAKAIVLIFFYVQYIFMYILRRMLHPPKYPIVFQIKILQFIFTMNLLHIIFYIDLLSFHLHELNSAIQNGIIENNDQNLSNVVFFCKKSSNKLVIRDRIKCYKCIHFRLWEVAQQFNCYFGWCMVPMALHSFASVVYYTYWLVQHMHISLSFLDKFCKYKILIRRLYACACCFQDNLISSSSVLFVLVLFSLVLSCYFKRKQ